MAYDEAKNKCVDDWLTNVGLGYAVNNFRMAGIVSPRSLAELELGYFEALGVKKPEDRKKLFFLVQRVKTALEDLGDGNEESGVNEGTGDGGDRDSGLQVEPSGEGSSSERSTPSPPSFDESDEDRYSNNVLSSPNSKVEIVQESKARGKIRDNDRFAGVSCKKNDPMISIDNRHPSSGVSTMSSRRNGDDSEVVLSVETNQHMEPISPVTLASPLSVEEGIDLKSNTIIPQNNRIRKKLVSAASRARGNEGTNTKLDRHALKRHQEQEIARTATRSNISASYNVDDESHSGNGYQDDFDELDEYLGSDGDSLISNTSNQCITKRSAAASMGNQSQRSNFFSRPSVKKTKQDGFDELDEYLASDGGSFCSKTSEQYISTPKAAAPIGARSQRGRIHSRPTIKKTNQSKIRPCSSAIFPSALSSENDDDQSIRSESSDITASIHSLSSLGSSLSNRERLRMSGSSRASTGAHAVSRSMTSASRIDENRHKNVDENKIKSSLLLKGPRIEIKSSIPSRTGKKRLSSIPSTKIAPVSPLAGLSSMQLDESIAAKSGIACSRKTSVTSKRRSLVGKSASKSETADSSGSKSAHTSMDVVGDLNRSFGSTSTCRSLSSNASKSSTGLKRPNIKSGVGDIGCTNSSSRPSSRSSLRGSQQSEKLDNSTISRSEISASPRVQIRHQPRSPKSSDRSQSKSPVPLPRVISSRSNRSESPVRKPREQSNSPSMGVQGRSMSPTRCDTRTTSPYRRPLDRHVSPMERSYNRSISPKSPGRSGKERNESPINSGPFFVHGLPEDNSWATQISRLRESFNQDHAEYMMNREAYREDEDYEMRIRVIVRKRPLSKLEASERGEIDVIHPLDYDDYGRVLVYQPKTKLDLTKEVETTSFAFDNVFNENSNNMEIYSRAVQSLIPGVFRGKWASVFAYGQTGSGKTVSFLQFFVTFLLVGISSCFRLVR